MKINPLNCIDFYKADHRRQYPKGTECVYSNFTPRSDKLANLLRENYDGKVVFFGLQGFIKWYLIDCWNEEFFRKDKAKVVAQYKRRMDTSLGKDAIDTKHIEDLWELGYLPIEIRALPEGSRVPTKVPVFTIHNTMKKFFWLTNYLETVLSSEIWKPCTTATIAYEYRKLLDKYAEETGAPLDFVPLQGHDFSCRGLSGIHDTSNSGSGHLLSFVGTDSILAIDYLEEYYEADAEKELVGCSVPATEHSVMCMGSKEGEIDTFKRLITEVYPSGIVSIVSDTWDFWQVINEFTVELKDEILNRTPNELGIAKTVFRPDSGDPVEIICGIEIKDFDKGDLEYKEWREYVRDDLRDILSSETPHGKHGGDIEGYYRYRGQVYLCNYHPDWGRHDKQYYYIDECGDQLSEEPVELTPEQKGAVECLWDIFGGTKTEKGFKVLNERVGLIYGDSITLNRANRILEKLKEKGFASNNIVFGIGAFTYQFNTRDTFGFAMKATYGEINGESREIFKDPITDSGIKKSAKGLLEVRKDPKGEFYLVDQIVSNMDKFPSGTTSELKTVYKDGVLTINDSLGNIRDRLLNK